MTGGVLVTGGLVGLSYGLIEAPGTSWTAPRPLTALTGGVVLLAAFVAWNAALPCRCCR